MKTITRILMLLSVVLFAACQGEEGPMGPPGEDGEDGYNILGTVYEIQGSFNQGNDYTLYYKFPTNLVNGDVVMVYILWEQANNDQGGMLDVWRALPQTIFLNNGTLQYNFDYTLGDAQIFLDGTIDPSLLSPGDTDNQIFRIAIIPANLAMNKSIDLTNFNAVMSALKLSANQIKIISAEKPVISK